MQIYSHLGTSETRDPTLRFIFFRMNQDYLIESTLFCIQLVLGLQRGLKNFLNSSCFDCSKVSSSTEKGGIKPNLLHILEDIISKILRHDY
jgi:hypothetical protein